MQYKEVCLESFGYVLPERIMTSLEIEDRIKPLYEKLSFKHGRLQALTGIKERRVWPLGTRPSTVAAEAAEKAISNSKIDRRDIGLLIHAGVCRDALEPSTASIIHSKLKLDNNCLAFDISNACIGFLNSISVAANMIELGQIKSALVVTGENSAPLYECTINKLLEDPTEENFRRNFSKSDSRLSFSGIFINP